MAVMFLVVMLLAVHSISDVAACSCLISHPQTLFCEADFVMQMRLRGKPEDIYKKEAFKVFNRETNSSDSVIRRNKVATRYNVKIRKLFKANENSFGLNKNSTVTQLYSPPESSLCGIDLLPRTNYLISGKYFNGELHINLCTSLYLPWQWVTKIQKKGLKFNYGMNCGCKPIPEEDSRNMDNTNNVCRWKKFSKTGNCYTRNTACIQDKNSSTGGCKWQRNSRLRKCKEESKSGRTVP